MYVIHNRGEVFRPTQLIISPEWLVCKNALELGGGCGLAPTFEAPAPIPDHKNCHISTSLQRQKLPSGVTESSQCKASFQLVQERLIY